MTQWIILVSHSIAIWRVNPSFQTHQHIATPNVLTPFKHEHSDKGVTRGHKKAWVRDSPGMIGHFGPVIDGSETV